MVRMIDVTSSNVAAIGYDREGAGLYVRFKSGKAYRYEGVPEKVWQGFLKASSKGTYLNTEVKLWFKFTELEDGILMQQGDTDSLCRRLYERLIPGFHRAVLF